MRSNIRFALKLVGVPVLVLGMIAGVMVDRRTGFISQAVDRVRGSVGI